MRKMPLAVIVCLGLCSCIVLAAQTPSNGNLSSNPVFEKNCAKCHGKTGEGRFLAGPSLKSEKVAGTASGDLRAIIANGKGRMPKFGEKLTSEEIATLAEQVKSLK